MIRIDDVRALRHDLHMRPFEADRRVYLVLDADRMNEDAADALLKDLEEPPPYAVIVLVASELGPLPPTILSRCQLVPFRRLSERAVREWIAARAPERSEEEVRALARAAAGRLDRARRLLDPAAAGAARGARSPPRAPSTSIRSSTRPPRRRVLLAAAGERGEEAREREQDAGRRARPARRATPTSACGGRSAAPSATSCSRRSRASRPGTATSWSSRRAPRSAAVHADRLDELREDVGARARRRRGRRPRRPCARPGARSRSSTSTPRSRSRRSSSAAARSSGRRCTRGRRARRLRSLGPAHPARPVALGCEVPVVARSEASRARAEEGGASAIVSRIDELPALDGVVVATTTSTHAAVIEELLGRGSPRLHREAAHRRPRRGGAPRGGGARHALRDGQVALPPGCLGDRRRSRGSGGSAACPG